MQEAPGKLVADAFELHELLRKDFGALFKRQLRNVKISAAKDNGLPLLDFNGRVGCFRTWFFGWEIFNVCEHVGAPLWFVGFLNVVLALFIEAQKVLLSVGPNLAAGASTDVLLDQAPVLAVQL